LNSITKFIDPIGKLRSRVLRYLRSREAAKARTFAAIRLTGFPCWVLIVALTCPLFVATQAPAAQGEGLTVSDAWTPATDEVGRDIPLLATIRNQSDAPDALMRVRCPVANFSEKHTIDHGEGAPAMRAISSIPIPAGSSVIMKPTEYHVMLLQTRQPLTVGGRFSCALVFQKAGTIETEVEVRRSP
jgi:periplasmic copper chaperone A